MDTLAPAVQLFEVKDALGIEGGSEDSKLISLIDSASDYAEREMNRTLGERTAITEFHGTSRRTKLRRIWTKRAPITVTTTVDLRVDGNRIFPADSQLIEETGTGAGDFVVDRELGHVEMFGDSIFIPAPRGPQTIRILYSAGYLIDDMPPAIKEGIIALIDFLRLRKVSSALVLTSKSIAGGTEGFKDELPAQWVSMLARYRRFDFAPGF